MAINSPSTNSIDAITILRQAATTFQTKIDNNRPNPKTVTRALLEAEKTAKQEHRQYPLESLLGQWRLCFTTAGKVNLRQGMASGKSGFYVLQFVSAQISFTATTASDNNNLDKIEIGNQVQLGFLLFRVTGQARYLERKNLLAFDFTHMQFVLFGKTFYRGAFPGRKTQTEDFLTQPIAKLAFFTFFSVTKDFIAARGRGGGLALWVRQP
jgi:hypothetical protein